MRRTRIKLCGMTRPEDAEAAARLGADAIGLILARGGPRFISLEQAAIIRRRLPPFVQAVAVFRNPAAAEVEQALAALRPDLLQFHGEESPEFCERFGVPYLRAVPMQGTVSPADWARRYASATALLLDAHAPGEQGGQGRSFDWSRVPADLGKPVVLAGGLKPDTVGEAVRRARPYAVDAASGVEASPGIKDQGKMRAFIEKVRQADEN